MASSRWAGAITRAVEDQYQLGMRALAAQVADLRSAVAVLESRCALRPGEIAGPSPDAAGGPRQRSRRPVRGYANARQRYVRPGAWPRCVGGCRLPRRIWKRVGRRSRWAVTGCGATANILMPPS